MTDIRYSPLRFPTVIGDSEQMRFLASELSKHEGKTLDRALVQDAMREMAYMGQYEPENISASAKKKIEDNKALTDREEAEFAAEIDRRGGFSLFDEWFHFAKEMGFAYYRPGEMIEISRGGRMLACIENSADERAIFINAFAKYQNSNPFRRVMNKNAPLAMLLSVIAKLNDDNPSDFGISAPEIALLLYWKNNNADDLYLRIKRLRKECGHAPADKVIADICRDEIMEGSDIKRSDCAIVDDYPTNFIINIRRTGLISFRKNAEGVMRFKIDSGEEDKVPHILRTYSKIRKFSSEREYFQYMSAIDGHFCH